MSNFVQSFLERTFGPLKGRIAAIMYLLTSWMNSMGMIPIIYGRKNLNAYQTPWESFLWTLGDIPKEFVHEVFGKISLHFPTYPLVFVELWTNIKINKWEKSLPKTSGMIPKEFRWRYQRLCDRKPCEWFPRFFLPQMMGNNPIPYGKMYVIEA